MPNEDLRASCVLLSVLPKMRQDSSLDLRGLDGAVGVCWTCVCC